MKVISHQHELMQKKLALIPIIKHYLKEQVCHPLRLKHRFLLGCARGDEISAVSSIASVRSCHEVPQRLKPCLFSSPYRSAGSAAPPKNSFLPSLPVQHFRTASESRFHYNGCMNDPLIIAGRKFGSRLIVGTGKYKSFQETARSLEASGPEIVPVAVRQHNTSPPHRSPPPHPNLLHY